MSSDTQYADIVKRGSKRVFVQQNGASPINKPRFHGIDTQYLAFEGAKRPINGAVNPINMAHPRKAGKYIRVGRTVDAPGLPTATVKIQERIGTLPFSLTDLNCPATYYLVQSANCADLANFDYGWNGYVEIWSDGIPTDVDMGVRSPFTGDDPIEDSISYVFDSQYEVAALAFGVQVPSTGLGVREIVDATFYGDYGCNNCGIQQDGTRWRYALRKEASGTTSADVLYSVDGGATWTALAITGIVNTEVPVAIRVVGNFLVVLSPTAGSATQGGYYFTAINPLTGVPSSTWTKVTAGFPTGSQLPRDMFVLSPTEIFISCDAGFVLVVSSIPSGASNAHSASATAVNLSRIRGVGDVLVAVGATGKVLRSTDRGRTWSLTTVDPSATSLISVDLPYENVIWVGDSAGGSWYSLNSGESWVSNSFGLTLASVNDINFVTPEVGFVAATVTGPSARIFATINGGQSWVPSSVVNPRMLSVPSYGRPNRIVVPSGAGLSIATNNLMVAGLQAGTTGVLISASANVL